MKFGFKSIRKLVLLSTVMLLPNIPVSGVAQDHVGFSQIDSKQLSDLTGAAEAGDVRAENELGILYEKVQDYSKALEWYQKAAAQNNPQAMGNLGRLYSLGLGVPKDESMGLAWMQKSADAGSAEAQNFVGLEYIKGQNYRQDYQKAFDYLNKAVNQNNASAQANLARMYIEGMFVAKNFLRAGELYGLALNGNIPQKERQEIQTLISSKSYECSKNMKPDGNIVYDLDSCFLALSSKDPAVLHAVALAFLSGQQSVSQDKGRAFQYLNESAKAGFPSAQIHLAVMYDEADGVPQDLVETYAWFSAAQTYPQLVDIQNKAAEAGKKSALERLGLIERWRAKDRAKEYIQKYGFNS